MKSWKSICLPWAEGGFGVKELLSWNRALLLRWVWMLDQDADSVWQRWHKYYVLQHESIWDIASQERYSVSLKGILSVRDACIQLAGGTQAAKAIIQGCIQNNQFSVSTAYAFFRTKAPISRGMAAIHSSSVVPAHQIVAALAIQNCLATVDKLQAKGLYLINRCTLCKEAAEDHQHLFFQCKYSKDVWQRILLWMGINRSGHPYWKELHWIRTRKHSKAWRKHWFLCGLAATVYMLWAERNARIFRGQERTVTRLVGYFKTDNETKGANPAATKQAAATTALRLLPSSEVFESPLSLTSGYQSSVDETKEQRDAIPIM
ncbi:uncharacterized protein LOC141600994 [Silene latifolia]|uniref:uncharacterized protein LOC141600994 n=1 Tax=Silene latifolia TaxID=37657 RepID=UPI003D786995